MAETSPQPQSSSATNCQSPPPNCAICLGNCINKCFSDSCMHQFCFNCLLEWSKVKAVCPLCKQPFTSIIHNVKSNNEYDEHFITNEERSPNTDDILENFLTLDRNVDRHGFYLPSPFPAPSRHFQFRTTFTVDPRGELAIQQLLSTHPLTNVCGYHNQNHFYRCHRRPPRDVSTSNYRRSIYDDNMWVHALPDVTGRFREISPQFFSENPAARNQLVPWLNRELNALLNENTQHVMYVVDVILTQLNRHHIRSRFFKNLLHEYLGNRTEHFIHEFYNFMRSPYDMIGYDRYAYYQTSRPDVSVVYIDDEDSSDDVVFVSMPERPPPPVIEITSDSSRDSDVIIREPTPPVVVDLINSNSSATEMAPSKPVLPLKIRLKHKRQCREKRNRKSQDYTSTDSSSSASDTDYNKHYRKRKYKHKMSRQTVTSSQDESSDDEPILSRLQKVKDKRKKEIKNNEGEFLRKLESLYPSSNDPSMQNGLKREISDYDPIYTAPMHQMIYSDAHKSEICDINQPSVSWNPAAVGGYDQNHALQHLDYGSLHKKEESSDINQPTVSGVHKIVESIINTYENPGPSSSKPVVGNECKTWYSRPSVYSSDYSSD